MPPKHSSPDWFARGVAIFGIVLTIASLALAYYNYHWQETIYQESTAERILVRLNASRLFGKDEPGPKGKLELEIVNIGLRPLYLKRADLRIERKMISSPDLGYGLTAAGVAKSVFTFFEHDPTNTKEPTKALSPSESANYNLNWDFIDHPLVEWAPDSKTEDLELQIETTKTAFSFPHQTVNSVTVYGFPPARPERPRHAIP